MFLKDLSTKAFSSIAKALKVSKHGGTPLTHIVQIVREHFHAEACSLYELRHGAFNLVASDGDSHSTDAIRLNTQRELAELAAGKKEAVFSPETGIIPLVYQEKFVGALTLNKNSPNGFTSLERRFLEFIALQLAGMLQSFTAIERAKTETKEDRGPLVIQGIGVSQGFGIGPALFLHAGITSMGFSKPSVPGCAEDEESKLQSALRRTSEDLLQLEKNIGNELSKGESGIFTSHQAFLSDAGFLEELGEEIRKGKSALEAVGDVLQEYVRRFNEMKDSRFRETAVDLEELRQRLFENILGMESRQEKEDWAGILVAKSLGPSDTIRLDASKILGIITTTGGPTSHAAILARSLGIPAVMGAAGIMEKIDPGALLIVDGDEGKVIAHPSPSILHDYEVLEEKLVAEMVALNDIAYEPAVTLDGRSIHLEANASFASDVKKLRYFGAEGVGLFRTEFLFLKGKELPDESKQFDIYRQVIEGAGGLPVTFRILDAGGDKFIEALSTEKEENPFLGCRSIRLTLSQPGILKAQFRALLRASAFGSIRLLIPMVSGMEELDAIKEIFETAKQELAKDNLPYDRQIPFGLMIEVPSAVSLAHALVQHADFLSIGTNDLIQYTLAVDRNNERVASFFEPLHPAILSFISQVAQVGLNARKPVGICGEMAGNPFIIPLLVGLGITHLSMVPSLILEAKKTIRRMDYRQAQKMAQRALRATRIREVKAILGGEWQA